MTQHTATDIHGREVTYDRLLHGGHVLRRRAIARKAELDQVGWQPKIGKAVYHVIKPERGARYRIALEVIEPEQLPGFTPGPGARARH
jgi:hypothetical protein